MISATQTGIPEGTALLRSFRFDGLEVGRAGEFSTTTAGHIARCDVLLALDFAGTAGGTLAERLADAARRIGGNGVLLLALPNRFGLRFWSGCPEPATGRLFTTLSGSLPTAPAAQMAPVAPVAPVPPAAAAEPRFFVSRKELQEALAAADLAPLEWFFAVPDAAESGRSGTLVSERLLASAPSLAAELASARPSADRLRPRLDLFSEALVGRELARSGLFAEFANHFLVAAAARQPDSAAATAGTGAAGVWARLRPPAQEFGWHFPAGRKELIATVFELGPGGITVGKRHQAGVAALDRGGFLWSAPARAPLSPGEPVRLRLQEHLVAGRSAPFLDELADLYQTIRGRFGREANLAGDALDAILTNATRDRAGLFHLFDLEWRAQGGVAASWWILRNVLACLGMRGSGFPLAATGAELYARLCQHLAVPAALAADLTREAEFGAAVSGSAPELGEARLAAALAQPWPVPVAQGLDAAQLRPLLELGATHQQLVADYRALEGWLAEARRQGAVSEEEYRRLASWATGLQQANASALAEYRRLESWAVEVQQTNATLLADYRRLESWARELEEKLQQHGAGPEA